jgi:hypothetical protein
VAVTHARPMPVDATVDRYVRDHFEMISSSASRRRGQDQGQQAPHGDVETDLLT